MFRRVQYLLLLPRVWINHQLMHMYQCILTLYVSFMSCMNIPGRFSHIEMLCVYQSPFCLVLNHWSLFISHELNTQQKSVWLFNPSLLKLISFTRVIQRAKLTFRWDCYLIFINWNVASVLFEIALFFRYQVKQSNSALFIPPLLLRWIHAEKQFNREHSRFSQHYNCYFYWAPNLITSSANYHSIGQL